MRVSSLHLTIAILFLLDMIGCTDLLSGHYGDFEPDSSFSDTLPAECAAYDNPIIPGFYPDPSLCRVGEDYYLVNSSFEYFPGIPVFHSRNLVDWRQIGHCLTSRSQLDVTGRKSSGGISAPTIRHHNGLFYVIATDIGGRGNFIVTAADPAGPWSDPLYVHESGFDPSLFFDDDGRCYYTSQEGSGTASHIIQYEIDVVSGRFIGKKRYLWEGTGEVWTEGPHLYKINRSYYLFAATGGTSLDHQEIVAGSRFPEGPFIPCPQNPILSNRNTINPVQCTGHADLVQDQNNHWWAVFLAVRRLDNSFSMLGRETFLTPVQWKNGWPVMGENGRVGLTMKGPLPFPLIGQDSAFHEDFNGKELPLGFCFIRNPELGSWSLTERPGWMRLFGNSATLSDQASPAFVGHRQRVFNAIFRTRLSFTPLQEGEEAGLAVRLSERAHYDLAIARHDTVNEIFVRSRCNDTSVVVGREVMEGTVVILQIESSAIDYTFSFSTDSGSYSPIAVLWAKDISPESNALFTGAVIGMYATGNGRRCSSPADFDWFECLPR